MRTARLLVTLIGLAVVAAAAASCERETATDDVTPAPAPSTEPSLLPTSPSSSDTTAPATQPAASDVTTTTAPATTAASGDPLATPNSAIAHLFELMRKQDVDGVRAMMADPLPADALRGEVNAVAKRLGAGATWEVVDTAVHDNAALVLFRTTFPDGKDEVTPLIFVNRYERWKVQLGPLNLKKYTPGEKTSMNKVLEWGVKRMAELRGATTTMPSTTPVAPPPTPGEAATGRSE